MMDCCFFVEFQSHNFSHFELCLPLSSVGIVGLAGATADVHCYDVLTNKWSR